MGNSDTRHGYMPASKSDEWTTPEDLYVSLDLLFHFNLDAAATNENAKCGRFFTAEDDGLKQDWGGCTVFCNPPYGRGLKDWVKKGYEESKKPGTTVVMLLPARTDTGWFHEYAQKGRVAFIRGRLKYGGAKYNAPFPSMIVIFD